MLLSVPAVHLASALTSSAGQTIAFSTNVIELFIDANEKQKLDEGLPVLIYASLPQAGNAELFAHGAVVARADFVRWRRADKNGVHPGGSAVRPISTKHDGPTAGFIEVGNLQLLPTPLKILDACRRAGGSKFSADFVPRGPTIALSSAG